MICTKEIKIIKTDNLNADYIEEALKATGLDVLRWAITSVDDTSYTLDVAIVEKK